MNLKHSILFILGSTLFFTGCSSYQQNVVFDNPKNNHKYTNVDNKLDNIEGIDTIIEENVITETNILVKEDMSKKENSNNTTTVNISGKDFIFNSIHFDFGKYNINETMYPLAKKNNETVKDILREHPNTIISLSGNCDEWGTDEFNFALGLKRAKSVKDFLISDGIPSQNVSLVSFGESNPLCNTKKESCWKLNRRTDYNLK